MSYSVPAFRPQIYSYQSRSRFRQYPRQVVTSIPGAGYAVKNLRWGEQAIDLSGLGTAPMVPPLWWKVPSALATSLNYPQQAQAVAAGGPVYLALFPAWSDGATKVGPVLYARFGTLSVPHQFSSQNQTDTTWLAQLMHSLQASGSPGLTDAQVTAQLQNPGASTDERPAATPNHTALYIGLGVGAAALIGGGLYFMKRGKKAA
jgi:hypothetical protein